jgi:putative oxidoreductase
MGQINTTPPQSSAGSLTESLERLAPYVLSIVRIMVALLFLEHGLAKLFVFPQQSTPPPELFSLVWFSGAIELVGGAFAAVGLFTRAAAFIMSGEMAVGYFMAHAPQSFFPLINRGDGAILYCFIFLYLFFAGPGPWSLDALIWRRTGQAL